MYALAELAEIIGGTITRGDPKLLIQRVMPADAALEDAITFVVKPKFLEKLAASRAGAVMISPELVSRASALPEKMAIVSVAQPYTAFARAAQIFAAKVPAPLGVHASAVLDESASIGASVAIGPFVYVGPRAAIGDGAVLYAGVHVEAGARVGAGSVLYNHVVVRHGCTVGARNILHPGVVIGSDGFGFAQAAPEDHVKIPQTGTVELGDDVEIGSNSCVDRATFGATRIGAGTKIDNLVQIGHNVEVGPGCILVAQSGVAGSSKLGAGVVLAAQSGVSGHLEVGDRAVVCGQAGVMDDVPAGERVMGSPSVPQKDHFRSLVRIRALDALFDRVKKLELLIRSRG